MGREKRKKPHNPPPPPLHPSNNNKHPLVKSGNIQGGSFISTTDTFYRNCCFNLTADLFGHTYVHPVSSEHLSAALQSVDDEHQQGYGGHQHGQNGQVVDVWVGRRRDAACKHKHRRHNHTLITVHHHQHQHLHHQFSSVRFLTCTFRASCCSTRLSLAHTPVINWVAYLGYGR